MHTHNCRIVYVWILYVQKPGLGNIEVLRSYKRTMSNTELEVTDPESVPTSTVCLKRRTNAGPWRNKEEFDQVHDWIFGSDSSRETKEKAVRQLKIWKLRRHELTSGALLSTLLILDAELKDDIYTEEGRSQDVCVVYSSAFTRFLNSMMAISQTQNMKTMYAAAREMNIDPFLVDLRHICAHNHAMPSLDVFRRTCKYCLNWLREFYWDIQKETMTDVDAKSLRKKDITTFDVNVREQFLIYDAATEALARHCTRVAEAKKHLPKERFTPLKNFATTKNVDNLESLVDLSITSIHKLVRQGCRLKDLVQIFVDAFFGMTYFFEIGCDSNNVEETKALIGMHQNLFQTVAMNGFMEDLYHALVEIAENESESCSRRKGASFWAKQILIGVIAFRKVKMMQYGQKEQNVHKTLSLSTINVKAIAKNIIEAYKKLGFNVESTLIFGDSIKCPWTLSFNEEYLKERLDNLNEYTDDVIRIALDLMEPNLLSDRKRADFLRLINIYLSGNDGNIADSGNTVDALKSDDEMTKIEEIHLSGKDDNMAKELNRIYTLKTDVPRDYEEDDEMKDVEEETTPSTTRKYGIWTKLSNEVDWSSCPLGRLIWE